MTDWHIQIMNITTMEKVLDQTYSDTDLMEKLLIDTHSAWQQVFKKAEECGIAFDITIKSISDYQKFVEAFVADLAGDDWRVTRTEPRRHNNIGAGHPDFIVEYEGDGETKYVDDTIYVEFKNTGDALRRTQVEWMLENIASEREIWILWVSEE